MHDPMVVAFSVPGPIPRLRRPLLKADTEAPRWGARRKRYTNPEHLGEPIYRLWRRPLHAFTWKVAGRQVVARSVCTIWHNEPGGRDAFEVCKQRRQRRNGEWTYHRRWAWHVHHWSIQIGLLQTVRRFLLERCGHCGYRYPWGYAPVSHQWESPKPKHWWSKRTDAYHHQCSSVLHFRQSQAERDDLIRHVFAALRLELDLSEQEMLARLTDPSSRSLEFRHAYSLMHILGYERDEAYRLVKSEA